MTTNGDDKATAPEESQELVAGSPRDVDQSEKVGDIFTEMTQLIPQAILALLQQNIAACEAIQSRATQLHSLARSAGADQSELLALDGLKSLISMYLYVARANRFQFEGRFEDAKSECRRGLALVHDALDALNELQAIDPSAAADEDIGATVDTFRSLKFLFTASEILGSAEQLGYEGRTSEYIKGLELAIAQLRRAAEEASGTAHEAALVMRRMCTEMADRLQTRVHVFSAKTNERVYSMPKGDKIFIIHGHDEGKWRELRDLIEKEFELETVVLQEEEEGGRNIFSKFLDHAEQSCYAIALLTPDDVVRASDKSYSQARPNVLFELGWFYGRYGPGRVCIVKKAGTEVPSDLAGILTLEFNQKVEEKSLKIRNELKSAGVFAIAAN